MQQHMDYISPEDPERYSTEFNKQLDTFALVGSSIFKSVESTYEIYPGLRWAGGMTGSAIRAREHLQYYTAVERHNWQSVWNFMNLIDNNPAYAQSISYESVQNNMLIYVPMLTEKLTLEESDLY